MTANIMIRPVSHQDVEALIDVYIACFAEPPWNERFTRQEVRDDFERVCAFPEAIFLAARFNGQTVGAGIAYHLCRKTDVFGIVPEGLRNSLYLADLFVRQDARGKGLGRRLAHARLSIAGSAGFVDAVVRTSGQQFVVLALYERLGFQRVAEQRVVSRKIVDGVEQDLPDHRVILAGGTFRPYARERRAPEYTGNQGH